MQEQEHRGIDVLETSEAPENGHVLMWASSPKNMLGTTTHVGNDNWKVIWLLPCKKIKIASINTSAIKGELRKISIHYWM